MPGYAAAGVTYSQAVTASIKAKDLRSALTRAGFPDAREEVREMITAADGDPDILHGWMTRRLDGEPLPWLTGVTTFLGNTVHVDRGVYVPRPQTELIARRAIDRLPDGGLACDLATGSGALAVAMANARRGARVIATDIDGDACSCARKNNVEVYQGNLGSPIPADLRGSFDVVVAVVPYVPTDKLEFLPRDVRRHEPRMALDGGSRGLIFLEQAVSWGARLLRQHGTLLLELGGDQDSELLPALAEADFTLTDRLFDEEGDLRGIEADRL
jgi:release factor glutamine methyltransferase